MFLSLLFEKIGLRDRIESMINTCIEKVRRNDIQFSDRVYYVWVLWKYGKYVEGREWPSIVGFAKNTLENLSMLIDETVVNEEIIEVYGPDVKRMGISKILLATALDFTIDFNKSLVFTQIPAWPFIERKLKELDWNDVLRELNFAVFAFEENRMSDCCNNLRMALITLLAKMHQLLEKNPPPIRPGQTLNLRLLFEPIRRLGLDDQAAGLI